MEAEIQRLRDAAMVFAAAARSEWSAGAVADLDIRQLGGYE